LYFETAFDCMARREKGNRAKGGKYRANKSVETPRYHNHLSDSLLCVTADFDALYRVKDEVVNCPDDYVPTRQNETYKLKTKILRATIGRVRIPDNSVFDSGWPAIGLAKLARGSAR
jgi:hypothetical protein